MAEQSWWKRWFGRRKEVPPPEEPALTALRKAYLQQRRRWDYTITTCSLFTLLTTVVTVYRGYDVKVLLLPLSATAFAIRQYQKCNRFIRTVREIEVLQRWIEKLQEEARREAEEREAEAQRRQGDAGSP